MLEEIRKTFVRNLLGVRNIIRWTVGAVSRSRDTTLRRLLPE